MIYLYKSQANTAIFTLNEAATNTTFDVLFEFINVTTGEEKLFTQTDTSQVERYNKFIIIESNTENLYNGTIKLEAGQWTYTVYEMPVASPPSLSKVNSVGVLEIGRITVQDATSDVTEYGNDTKDNPTFE
jgi:hypothetical protein